MNSNHDKNDRESLIRRTQEKAFVARPSQQAPVWIGYDPAITDDSSSSAGHVARTSTAIPEDIRLTLVALVTERLIQMHHQPMRPGKATEFKRLKPAAEWLLGQSRAGGTEQ